MKKTMASISTLFVLFAVSALIQPDRAEDASGALGMTLRLYAPRKAALNGEWNPPVVKRVQ